MKKTKNIFSIFLKIPLLTIAIFLLVTGGAFTLLPKLQKDKDAYMIPKEHPSRVNWKYVQENYTATAQSAQIVISHPETIFNIESLQSIKNLTSELENIYIFDKQDKKTLEGLIAKQKSSELKELSAKFLSKLESSDRWEHFQELVSAMKEANVYSGKNKEIIDMMQYKVNPFIEITSISNTDNITSKGDELIINPIYTKVPSNQKEINAIANDTFDNEIFRGGLVSNSKKSTSLILELSVDEEDHDAMNKLYVKIKNTLASHIKNPNKYYVAGFPVVATNNRIIIDTDSAKLFPIVLLIVILTLLLWFRSFTGLITPIVVVIVSLIITLASKVLFNVPLNIVSSTLPVFILSIGIADGIHMVSEFKDFRRKGLNKKDAALKTFHSMFIPVVFTSITTAIAFASLATTEIIQMKHFGIFVAVGTMIAMILSLVLVPSLLMVLPARKKMKVKKQKNVLSEKILYFVTTFTMKKSKPVFAFMIIWFILCAMFALNIKVDNDPVSFNLPGSEIRVATEKLNEEAGGSINLNVLLKDTTGENLPFKKYKNIALVSKIEKYLQSNKLVGKTYSLSALIDRIHLVLTKHEKNNNLKAMSEKEPNLIAQYLLLYENGGGDILSDVVSNDYKEANITALLKTNSSYDVAVIENDLKKWANKNLPENIEMKLTGNADIVEKFSGVITVGLMKSLVISFVLTLVLLIFVFRSLKSGIVAVLPLFMAVITNFGVMGILNISLNVGTAVVSSIAIGIGVDFSIHYLTRFIRYMKSGRSLEESMLETVKHSGKAIMSNALTVALGFFALLFSSFTALVTMGWMISLAIIISAICTIIILPAVISVFPGLVKVDETDVDTNMDIDDDNLVAVEG